MRKRKKKSVPQQETVSLPMSGYWDRIGHALTHERIVVASGTVDTDMSHELANKLRYMDSQSPSVITLYLNTIGGSVNDGLAIYDLIRDLRSPVDVVATGACMSMGTIILQAGRKRLATPNTHFLLHELSMVNSGSLGQLRDAQKHAEKLQENLNSLLAKRTGQDIKKLAKTIERRDYFINSRDALEMCLIDGITEDKQ